MIIVAIKLPVQSPIALNNRLFFVLNLGLVVSRKGTVSSTVVIKLHVHSPICMKQQGFVLDQGLIVSKLL